MPSGLISFIAPSLLRVTVCAVWLVVSFMSRKHPKHVKKIIVKISSNTDRIFKRFLIRYKSVLILSSPIRFFTVLEIITAKKI